MERPEKINVQEHSRFEHIEYFSAKINDIIQYLMSSESLSLLERSEDHAHQTLVDMFFYPEEKDDLAHFQEYMRLQIFFRQLLKQIQIIKKYSEDAIADPSEFLLQEVYSPGERKKKPKGEVKAVIHPFAMGFVMSDDDYSLYRGEEKSGGCALVNGSAHNPELYSTIYLYTKDTYNYDPAHEPLHLIYALFSRDKLFQRGLPLEIKNCPFRSNLYVDRYYLAFEQLVRSHMVSVQTECASYLSTDISRYDMYSPLYKGSIDRIFNSISDINSIPCSLEQRDQLVDFFSEEAERVKIFCEEYRESIKKLSKYFNFLQIPRDTLISMALFTPMNEVDSLIDYAYCYADKNASLSAAEVDVLYSRSNTKKLIATEAEQHEMGAVLSILTDSQLAHFFRLPQYDKWLSQDCANSKSRGRLCSTLSLAAGYFSENQPLMNEYDEITPDDIKGWISEKIEGHDPGYHVTLYLFGSLMWTDFREVSIEVVLPHLKEKLLEECSLVREMEGVSHLDYFDLFEEAVNRLTSDPNVTYEELWELYFHAPYENYFPASKMQWDILPSDIEKVKNWKNRLESKMKNLPLIPTMKGVFTEYIKGISDDPRYHTETHPLGEEEEVPLDGFEFFDRSRLYEEIWYMIGDDYVYYHWDIITDSYRELLLAMSIEEMNVLGAKILSNEVKGADESEFIKGDFDFIYYVKTGGQFFDSLDEDDIEEKKEYYQEYPFGRTSYLQF